ncbi:HNH endonuclease [Microbacterium sp. Bi128]|uniref:HNH endonuclease n=1 Tax=Microbacterium sp. Bi128 TaxID=2821115 RepID=UPI001D6FE751|nr:hypothetical protein SRABI128_03824 [Microbacterium sp. Bi128]
MIPPFVYSVGEQLIVDAFEALVVKHGDYWYDPTLTQLKSNIKKHYKTMQGYSCCYCRQINHVAHGRAWDTEHIVPRTSHAEFMFTPLNLAAACPDCNGKKSDTQTLVDVVQTAYPTAGKDFHIVHPHFDEYSDHIKSGNFTYVPLSAKGSWTIDKCGLTRFAGRKFGWPETPTDTRFEESVDRLQSGDLAAVPAIAFELNSEMMSEGAS